MAKPCIIIRYDEIGLKSKPVQKQFENILIRNIRDFVPLKKEKISRKRMRIIIYTDKDVAEKVSNVFGVSSASNVLEINQDVTEIKKTGLELYKSGSFRVSSQRADKSFPLNSQELNRVVGAYIVQEKGAKVDLEHYDTNIGIEIFSKKAYVFNKIFSGFSGLPSGSQGNVLLVLEDRSSVLAGLMIMNRGCSLVCTGKKEYFDLLKGFGGRMVFKSDPNRNSYSAVVIGKDLTNASSFLSDKERFGCPVFYPLIGVDVNEIDRKYFRK